MRSLFACIAPTDDSSEIVPDYACVRPPPFDVDLPAISVENLRLLRTAVPALGRTWCNRHLLLIKLNSADALRIRSPRVFERLTLSVPAQSPVRSNQTGQLTNALHRAGSFFVGSDLDLVHMQRPMNLMTSFASTTFLCDDLSPFSSPSAGGAGTLAAGLAGANGGAARGRAASLMSARSLDNTSPLSFNISGNGTGTSYGNNMGTTPTPAQPVMQHSPTGDGARSSLGVSAPISIPMGGMRGSGTSALSPLAATTRPHSNGDGPFDTPPEHGSPLAAIAASPSRRLTLNSEGDDMSAAEGGSIEDLLLQPVTPMFSRQQSEVARAASVMTSSSMRTSTVTMTNAPVSSSTNLLAHRLRRQLLSVHGAVHDSIEQLHKDIQSIRTELASQSTRVCDAQLYDELQAKCVQIVMAVHDEHQQREDALQAQLSQQQRESEERLKAIRAEHDNIAGEHAQLTNEHREQCAKHELELEAARNDVIKNITIDYELQVGLL